MLSYSLRALLDFFLPRFCLFCHAPLSLEVEHLICPDCWKELPLITTPYCSCCGAPFKGAVGPEHLCQACTIKPPPFDRARAAARYEGSIRDAIHRLKYQRQLLQAEHLRQVLTVSEAASVVQDADLMLPVPLHPRRLRRRGFNQALLLGQAFPAIPLRTDVLLRQRWTVPQVNLSPQERQANVKGAFAVAKPDVIIGRSVLLLDDVYTTGATVKECTLALRRAGAHTVTVLTVARVGYA